MGVHVTQYMNEMKKEDNEKFKRHFSRWSQTLQKAGVSKCEDLYKKVHDQIRKNPVRAKKAGNKKPTRKVVTKGYDLVQQDSKNRKWLRHFRINLEERNARIAKKFAAAQEALANN